MAKCSREQPPGDDVRGPDPLLPPLPDVRAADDAGAAQPALRQGRQDHGEIPVKDRYSRTWAVARSVSYVDVNLNYRVSYHVVHKVVLTLKLL